MEMLLASLLMVWGNLSAASSDVTFEQLVQASLDSKNAIVEVQPGSATNGTKDPDKPAGPLDYLLPASKKDPEPNSPKVKGIYVTSHVAGGKKFDSLVNLLDKTELNAMVIDVKDDYGYITFDTGNPELTNLGTTKKNIADIHKLTATLQEHDIYPIGRIVVFKDSIYANMKPEQSYVSSNGTVWQNGRKESFVNPYLKEIWDYNINVAKEAAKVGFKEIQFDYVRFPEGFEKKADSLKYTKDDRSRIQVISEFVKYAKEQLEPLGVRVSVDIFGYAASVPAAEGIGQDFETISANVDVISPMIYPSHYSEGWFGAKVPDAAPYQTINGASIDTEKKLTRLKEMNIKPIIRPWIQDFTATWVKGHITYGKHELEEQIRALKDNGVEEYLLWNAGNNYTEGVKF
ncbi:GTP-binding protein [Paenibacillus albiflavus]|uniref:GTP-binding protein n=1 Tax=Paenibacillus albiflavus TaxID=2545760 RepID=A0A4R4E910_9BACL|nr:putative glycoside hydrolase [Paenibacillus albiflavus]TCZ74265.1 GTP-binding protein [Paenibacillus albiflavus]